MAPLLAHLRVVPAAGGTFIGSVPPNDRLAGSSVFAQMLLQDAGAAADIAYSAGLDLTLGY